MGWLFPKKTTARWVSLVDHCSHHRKTLSLGLPYCRYSGGSRCCDPWILTEPDNTTQVEHIIFWLVVEPTHLKHMLVKLGSSSPNRGENKTYFKPPPSLLGSCWQSTTLKAPPSPFSMGQTMPFSPPPHIQQLRLPQARLSLTELDGGHLPLFLFSPRSLFLRDACFV